MASQILMYVLVTLGYLLLLIYNSSVFIRTGQLLQTFAIGILIILQVNISSLLSISRDITPTSLSFLYRGTPVSSSHIQNMCPYSMLAFLIPNQSAQLHFNQARKKFVNIVLNKRVHTQFFRTKLYRTKQNVVWINNLYSFYVFMSRENSQQAWYFRVGNIGGNLEIIIY